MSWIEKWRSFRRLTRRGQRFAQCSAVVSRPSPKKAVTHNDSPFGRGVYLHIVQDILVHDHDILYLSASPGHRPKRTADLFERISKIPRLVSRRVRTLPAPLDDQLHLLQTFRDPLIIEGRIANIDSQFR